MGGKKVPGRFRGRAAGSSASLLPRLGPRAVRDAQLWIQRAARQRAEAISLPEQLTRVDEREPAGVSLFVDKVIPDCCLLGRPVETQGFARSTNDACRSGTLVPRSAIAASAFLAILFGAGCAGRIQRHSAWAGVARAVSLGRSFRASCPLLTRWRLRSRHPGSACRQRRLDGTGNPSLCSGQESRAARQRTSRGVAWIAPNHHGGVTCGIVRPRRR